MKRVSALIVEDQLFPIIFNPVADVFFSEIIFACAHEHTDFRANHTTLTVTLGFVEIRDVLKDICDFNRDDLVGRVRVCFISDVEIARVE